MRINFRQVTLGEYVHIPGGQDKTRAFAVDRDGQGKAIRIWFEHGLLWIQNAKGVICTTATMTEGIPIEVPVEAAAPVGKR